MPLVLCIETATQVCSVALVKETSEVAFKETQIKNSHAEIITVFIRDILAENGTGFRELDAIVVSKGPGSYTGLRIGVSTAKGLCYALNIPLIAISTLKVLVNGILNNDATAISDSVLFCPMIDARRMEVYSGIYNSKLEQVREIKAEVIEKNSFAKYLEQGPLIFSGDGSTKCKNLVDHPNAIFTDHLYPSAKHMVPLAMEAFHHNSFEDTAYFEPFYLKDFIPGIPKVKGLS